MKPQSSLNNVNDVRCVNVKMTLSPDVKKFRIDVKTVKSSILTLNDELVAPSK